MFSIKRETEFVLIETGNDPEVITPGLLKDIKSDLQFVLIVHDLKVLTIPIEGNYGQKNFHIPGTFLPSRKSLNKKHVDSLYWPC